MNIVLYVANDNSEVLITTLENEKKKREVWFDEDRRIADYQRIELEKTSAIIELKARVSVCVR